MTSGLRGIHDRVDVTSREEKPNVFENNDLISFRSPDKEIRGPQNSGQDAQAKAQVLADTAIRLRSGPQRTVWKNAKKEAPFHILGFCSIYHHYKLRNHSYRHAFRTMGKIPVF